MHVDLALVYTLINTHFGTVNLSMDLTHVYNTDIQTHAHRQTHTHTHTLVLWLVLAYNGCGIP